MGQKMAAFLKKKMLLLFFLRGLHHNLSKYNQPIY